MSKRAARRAILFLIIFAMPLLMVGQATFFLVGNNTTQSPAYFSSYPDGGYYEIDPNTIITALDQENPGVFRPFFGDPDREEPYYDSVSWTSLDYSKIANALSMKIWNEPLNLDRWKVIDMDLMKGCNDRSGFHTFTITYYKPLGITGWQRQYTTRLIEVYAWQGLIRWGQGAVFSTPLLLKWNGFNPTQFKITADDALVLAEINGGSAARLIADNSCRITLRVNQLDAIPHLEKWLVTYERSNFRVEIDPYSGKYKILH